MVAGAARVFGGAPTRLAGAFATIVALLLCVPVGARADEAISLKFAATGAEQTFVVPAGVSSIGVRAVGGRGFGGGAPAVVRGTLSVTPGETLYLEVAGDGGQPAGGFNGGGAGGNAAAGGGGGASDVRTAPLSAGLSPDTRLIVAAGSGGRGSSGLAGGAAGREGAWGPSVWGGEPGTQTAGGWGGEGEECVGSKGGEGQITYSEEGVLGAGGAGERCRVPNGTSAGGGGGGGGYYGGGGGGAYMNVACPCGAQRESEGAGGGGGSSLVPAGGSEEAAGSESEPQIELSFTQPEGPPEAVTGSASPIHARTATVHATVDPNHHEVTSCEFEYGTSGGYGDAVPCSTSPGSGDQSVAVSATLEGLAPETPYHYRIVASTSVGTSEGADAEFTTAQHEAPTVSAFGPTSGPRAGGTTVTLTGTELDYVTRVVIGSGEGTDLQHLSPTSLSVRTPAKAEEKDRMTEEGEAERVKVVGDLGEEAYAPGYFYYRSVPVVTKVSPKSGPAAGGETVEVKGDWLWEATEVRFGSTPGRIESNSYGSLEVEAPPHTAGKKIPVTVVTSGGISAPAKKGVFDFTGPTVTGVSPSSGPAAGGTHVTVTGSGFALGAGTRFLFGKRPATAVECSSTGECAMLAPAASAGTVYIVAELATGKPKSKSSAAGRYTYE